MSQNKPWVIVALAAATALPAIPVYAALEVVNVTARKRTESMQTVPIAVTAISAEQIQNRQITAVEDLGRSVPNLITTQSSGSPTNTRVFMRGLGQNESTQPTAESAVGLYIDDVYIARSNGANIGLYDVERIEVLRGPQGTLYGRNSTVGAMKIVTKKPSEDADLSLRIGYGSRDHQEYKVAGSIPFSDSWAGGFSVVGTKYDGYMDEYDALTGDRESTDLNARKYGGARFALSTIGDGDFQADFSVYAFKDDGDGNYATPLDPTTGKPVDNDLYLTLTSREQSAEADQWGGSANLSWDLSENLTLKSITGYRNVDNTGLIDISGRNSWYIETDVSSYQLSQEFQLQGSVGESFDWITGIYYLHEESESWSENTISGFISSVQDYEVETDSYAAFGEGTFHVTDRFDMTVGLRYSIDDKSFDGSTNSNLIFSNGSNKLSDDFEDWTSRVSFNYQATDNAMLFASYATGFKAGGFQGRAFNAEDQLAVYDPETVTTYEAGFKSDWLNQTLRVNGTYYYNNFKDLQLNSLNPVGGGTIVENAAEAVVDGIELEVSYAPTDSWYFFLNQATAWGEYREVGDLASGVTKDSELANTPTANTKLGAEYTLFISDVGSLTFGVDYQHTSATNPGASTSENVRIPRLDLFNGFIRYSGRDDKWDLGIYGTNLGDKEYHYTGFTFGSFESMYAAAPRTVKAVFNIHFF